MTTKKKLQDKCEPPYTKLCTNLVRGMTAVPECKAKYTDKNSRNWLCTREKGHTGKHICCGYYSHNLRTWK